MEQLFWSSTVFSTISTHLVMRAFNLLGLALFVLWVISPLGGQSSLHIITTEKHKTVSSTDVSYLKHNILSPLAVGGDNSFLFPTINSLYLASIIAPAAAQESPMDFWGNLKIPQVSRLPANLSTDSKGWIDVRSLSKIPYASLLGVPIKVPSLQANLSFTLESSYFDLDCFNITYDHEVLYLDFVDIPGPSKANQTDTSKVPGGGFIGGNGSTYCEDIRTCHISDGLGLNYFSQYFAYPDYMGQRVTFPNVTGNNQTFLKERPVLLFQSEGDPPNNTLAYCHIDQVYMESAVECVENGSSRPECAVKAIRDSRIPHPAKDVVPFIFNGFMSNFANAFGVSSGYGHSSTPTQTDGFMDSTPNSGGLNKIPKDIFNARLSEVINTYYQACLRPSYMLGNLPTNLDITESAEDDAGGATNQTATVTTWDSSIYTVHWGWAIVFLICSLAMFACAVFTAYIAYRSMIPDILGYVSSNLRDTSNPYFPKGGSYLNGLERSRLLENLPVKLGDVSGPGDDKPGYLAFSSPDMAKPVEKGRLYL